MIIMVMTASMGKGLHLLRHPGRHPAGQRDAAGRLLQPVFTDAALSNLSLVGSVLVFCVGLNLVWGKKIRVANLLPSLLHSRHMGVFVTINYKGYAIWSVKNGRLGQPGLRHPGSAAYGEQRAAVVGAENVFNFTIGNPSVPAPSCVRQTIEHLLQTVPAEQLHAYTAAPGLASVRAKMAAYLEKTFGVGYRAEDVYMTSGASSALAMLAYALLSPGDEVLTLSPYFSEYKLYAEAAGGTLTAVPSNPEDFQIDLTPSPAAISEKTAVVLLNSPNNPFRRHPLPPEHHEAGGAAGEKSAEYGHRISSSPTSPTASWLMTARRCRSSPPSTRTPSTAIPSSKTLSLPGERIGFLAIHPELTDYARVRAAIYGAGRALGYINASTMFQLVAAGCVGQTADISVYKQNRDLIHTALLDMGYTCVKPSGAFYLFLKTPEPDATASQRRWRSTCWSCRATNSGCPATSAWPTASPKPCSSAVSPASASSPTNTASKNKRLAERLRRPLLSISGGDFKGSPSRSWREAPEEVAADLQENPNRKFSLRFGKKKWSTEDKRRRLRRLVFRRGHFRRASGGHIFSLAREKDMEEKRCVGMRGAFCFRT